MKFSWLRRWMPLLLGAICLYSGFLNVLNIRASWDPKRVLNDPVTMWDQKRIGKMRSDIPLQRGIVGYVADWDIPGASWGLIDQDAEYTLTQYALAPLIVQRGLNHEWIVGNALNPRFEDWLAENLQHYTVAKYPGGIFLIHRLDK